MRTTRAVLLTLALLALFAASASAYSFRLEVMSTGALDSHSGYVLRSTEPGAAPEEFFVFLESGQVRFYAVREVGLPWDLVPPATYLTPASSATVGTTWSFLPDNSGGPSVATLEAFVSADVPAGTFSAIQCTSRNPSNSSIINEVIHFSFGTGLVREYFPADGATDELVSFNLVGGSGYFPLAVGNWWEYGLNVSAVGDVPGTANLLHAAVPNPFNPSTKISFEMAVAGNVQLAVFDAAGRHLRTLFSGQREAGLHTLTWDGRDDSGRNVAAGVYLYRLETGKSVQTRAMTLVK